jgi:CRP/FNR family transcriptional regulator, cyclic AMP receptor protein
MLKVTHDRVELDLLLSQSCRASRDALPLREQMADHIITFGMNVVCRGSHKPRTFGMKLEPSFRYRTAPAMTPRDLLRLHPFLGALTGSETQALLEGARTRMVAAGEVVFLRNDPGDGLYGVLSGSVLMVVDSVQGKELVLNRHSAGEFFGEVALLDGESRSATAVAYEPSKLIHIGRDRLLSFLKQRPEAMLLIVQMVCTRMRRVTHLVEDSLFLDVPTRLARQLAALAGARRSTIDGPAAATLQLSQNDLARMLGVSREFVSKQLGLWRDAGIVELSRRRITVRDPKALRQLCITSRAGA